MRKKLLFVCLCLCMLFPLGACGQVEDMGSLPEFSKPYVGEYLCEKLTLGGEEFQDKFEYVKLSLKNDGEFVLSYKPKAGGGGGAYAGEYAVNAACDEITLSAKNGFRNVKHTFPMQDGAILIDLDFHGKLLHAVFEFP